MYLYYSGLIFLSIFKGSLRKGLSFKRGLTLKEVLYLKEDLRLGEVLRPGRVKYVVFFFTLRS